MKKKARKKIYLKGILPTEFQEIPRPTLTEKAAIWSMLSGEVIRMVKKEKVMERATKEAHKKTKVGPIGRQYGQDGAMSYHRPEST